MNNQDKKQFLEMLNVCCELYSKPQLSVDVVKIWFNKLERFEIRNVGKAFNTWTDNHNRMPTPHDIIELCKLSERPEYSVKLVHKISEEQRQENLKRLRETMAQLNIRKIK